MSRAPGFLVLLAAAGAAAPAGQQPADPLSIRLEVLERILPDSPGAERAVDAIGQVLERAAGNAGLRVAAFEARSSPTTAPAGLGATRVEASLLLRPASGVDPARALHGRRLWPLVSTLSAMSRAASWRSVSFEGEGPDGLRMRASLVVYHRPSDAVTGSALVAAKVTAIESIRLDAHWPLDRLASIAKATADHTAFLTRLALRKDGIEADGFAVWPSSSLWWKPGPGLERTSLRTSFESGCERFHYEGRAASQPTASPELPEAPARPLRWVFAAAASRLCDVPQASTATWPPLGLSGDGPLSVEAVGLDLKDLVLLLHREARQNVVVDESVEGLLDVSLAGVTLDQALGALARFGVNASPPGRVRRVSMKTIAPSAPAAPGREPLVTLNLARAQAKDVLPIVQDMTGEPVLVPSAPLPRVSAFIEETPWDEAFAQVAASLGLELKREPGLVRFESDEAPADSGAVSTFDDLHDGLRTSLADVSCEALDLVAVSSTRGSYTAWFASPRGSMLPARAGDRCWDGKVASVDARGLELAIEISDPLSPVRTRTRIVKLKDR